MIQMSGKSADLAQKFKVERNVPNKKTIDLLYFWDVYDVNLWENLFDRSMAYSCRANIFI